MQSSLSHKLLLENEVYLQAVQHKAVSLQSLGLEEVNFSFSSRRNTTGKKSLKAVIPTNGQLFFLERAGVVSLSNSAKITSGPESQKRQASPKKHRSRAERELARLEAEKQSKNKKEGLKKEGEDPLFVSHPARRTSVGGTPLFTKPTKAFQDLLDKERDDAMQRNKDKERSKKLGSSFDIVDKEGVKYVYDNRGFKVTEESFQKYLDEVERDKKRRISKTIIPPHSNAIVEKTRKFVDDMRKRVEMVSKL